MSLTIVVIPHGSHKSRNIKLPLIGIIAPVLLATFGVGYLFSLAWSGLEYKSQHQEMVQKVEFYTEQFNQWDSTIKALKTVEKEFQELFAYKTKDEVLENVDTSFIGSLEGPELIKELKYTIDSVEEIKDYLRDQKDIYLATPKGYPVSGRITSPFGKRKDPFSGETMFHSGVDISSSLGLPIRATADGIVSLSGWTKDSGYVVVIEHGRGYTTLYAHNKSNKVKVGTRVKRGDVIANVGSTGKSTGPHVHYEVWKDGKPINAKEFLTQKS